MTFPGFEKAYQENLTKYIEKDRDQYSGTMTFRMSRAGFESLAEILVDAYREKAVEDPAISNEYLERALGKQITIAAYDYLFKKCGSQIEVKGVEGLKRYRDGLVRDLAVEDPQWRETPLLKEPRDQDSDDKFLNCAIPYRIMDRTGTDVNNRLMERQLAESGIEGISIISQGSVDIEDIRWAVGGKGGAIKIYSIWGEGRMKINVGDTLRNSSLPINSQQYIELQQRLEEENRNPKNEDRWRRDLGRYTQGMRHISGDFEQPGKYLVNPRKDGLAADAIAIREERRYDDVEPETIVQEELEADEWDF